MIGLVTDSNSQLPATLRDRYGIRVVPLTVVVDGKGYLEGVDLGQAEFLRSLSAGAQVSTAAPSPAQFARVYDELAESGSQQILSVHMGAALSGTFRAARLGAEASPVPVQLIDTGTASFAAGCCVWAAAEALSSGEGPDEAAEAARRAAARTGNVFVISSLAFARRGGRLADGADAERVPVVALEGAKMQVVGEVQGEADALEAMASYLDGWPRHGERLRVGVGDAESEALADGLASSLAERSSVAELVRYQVGPSVAAHTGPNTVGAVWTVV